MTAAVTTAPAPDPTLVHTRQGSGEPLVLLHGLGSNRRMWDPVLGLLAPTRDVIAVDLPGHGGSPPLGAGVEPTAPELARRVAALLDALGLDSAHVAGNSLGGWVALELGRSGRASSVTAISPAGFSGSAAQRAWSHTSLRASRATMRALDRALPRLVRVPGLPAVSGFHLLAHPSRMPADAALDAARALARSPGFEATLRAVEGRAFEHGEEITCPVTVAWGQHDRILPLRQLAVAAVRLPDARLLVLRGCGHVPTWDDPTQVARVLLDGSRTATRD